MRVPNNKLAILLAKGRLKKILLKIPLRVFGF